MRIVLAIALAAGLTATAAIAPPGPSHSALAARFGGAATAIGSGAPSRALGVTAEVSAGKWQLARKQPGTKAGTNRRRASASRGRLLSAERRSGSTLRRSRGASTHHELPPNLGIGIGVGL